ncbi:MAG: double-strand break repair helicase AddA [Pseudomonadota bacterium]
MSRNAASQRQVTASTPDVSTWLSANAGSGKTTVLTDRVARLLLAGTDPQNILCLTYTKAAATEMQNRLFKRLGSWAMMPDDDLRKALLDLELESGGSADKLTKARRLFALAIETPGGLKIQTIHSFCSSLLRRFPLEAGITPQFKEMEERASALLRADIVEQIAAGENADTLYALARQFSDETLDELTAEIVSNRDAFSKVPNFHAILNLPDGLDQNSLSSNVFLGAEDDDLKSLIELMRASDKSTDRRNAESLDLALPVGIKKLPLLEQVLLTGAAAKSPFSAKLETFPAKQIQNQNADLMPRIHALMQRVEDAREMRIAIEASWKSQVLFDFASVFIPTYERTKALRGFLDFDDLILRARDLLTDPKVADWVLFKLDGGIDHILVDEAQDTSPAQWQLIERLAKEITSGEGARSDTPRTVFVVGDKKQSIYSFQGADPKGFDLMKGAFASQLSVAQSPLQDLEMEYSFRSAQTILSLVDRVFDGREDSGFNQREPHKAFHNNMPGRVDLWPLVETPEKKEPPAWYLPVDIKCEADPVSILANRVAESLKEIIGSPLPGKADAPARAIKPGDILILVQRRSPIFHAIISACKTAGLPVAGADRLRIGAELAVKDIGALLSFLATPEDDLSLAVALRSPLFGWSEEELFDLAHERTQKYLWAELRNRAEDFPQTMKVLQDLRDSADYLRPYDMIQRILIRHDGRRKLLSRLGLEAEDGIDALLSQAMAYERHAVDSLTGFLVWMETDDLEIKRQMDEAGDKIRVMTIHGAKGLESPIVILPDCGKRVLRNKGSIALKDGAALWRAKKDQSPKILRGLDQTKRDADQAERDRLLYVAMTRAGNWLIAAAAGETEKDGSDWYSRLRAGMEHSGASPHSFVGGEGLRLQSGDWNPMPTKEHKVTEAVAIHLESFFDHQAPDPKPRAKIISPSDLAGSKALPGEEGLDEEAAKRRGRQIHKLLEFLPPVPPLLWSETAADLLSNGPDAADGEELQLLLVEADRVLTKASLQPIFSKNALAEVPISADWQAGSKIRIHGVIDRLVVENNRVLAVDFKTNAVVPTEPEECPDGLLRQMGAYSYALGQIYPDHTIETALLWTRNAHLMHLPQEIVIAALQNTSFS